MSDTDGFGGDGFGNRIPLGVINQANNLTESAQNSDPTVVAECPPHHGYTSDANMGPDKTMVASPPGCLVGSIYSDLISRQFIDLITHRTSPGMH